MSPAAALQSPVVRFYLMAAFGLLLVAGPFLAATRKTGGPAWQAYRGWLVIVPVLAAVIILGRTATITFFIGISLWGFAEFAQASGLSKDPWLAGGAAFGIVLTGLVSLGANQVAPLARQYDLFMSAPLFVVVGILAIPVLRNRFEGQLRTLAFAIVSVLFFGWMLGHAAFLANSSDAYAYLIYLLFAVELNDIAAFCAGKWLGRHPLRSNISPKKTCEGALGALTVSMVLPWALWFTFPQFERLDLIVIGIIIGVGGQLGDLVFSMIKRDLGIKDMGTSIPGHGGILDRIDSLIYVAPLYFHYLRIRHELLLP